MAGPATEERKSRNNSDSIPTGYGLNIVLKIGIYGYSVLLASLAMAMERTLGVPLVKLVLQSATPTYGISNKWDWFRTSLCYSLCSTGGAEHVWSEGDHRPAWHETTIIDRESHWKVRKINEAAHMALANNSISKQCRHQPNMATDSEGKNKSQKCRGDK